MAALGVAASGLFGLALFLWPAHLALSVAVGFGFGLANAGSKPPHFSLAIGLSDQHRGALLGLIALTNQVGFSIGAAIGGLIISRAGYGGVGILVVVFALVAGALLARLFFAPARPKLALARDEGRTSPPRPLSDAERGK